MVGDKFMLEMHLKQPGFTYSACGPFTKNKERIQKCKQTRDTNYIYKNILDKAFFQHDMVYGDFKDLAKRTIADKVLRGKAFKTASDQKYDGYQRGLASMLYKFFDKKSEGILVRKTDFDNILSSLNRKIVSNKAKDLVIENKLKKLKAFDSSYYNGKKYFDEDGLQII